MSQKPLLDNGDRQYDLLVYGQQVVLVNCQINSQRVKAGFLWFNSGTPTVVPLKDPNTNTQVCRVMVPDGNVRQPTFTASGDGDGQPIELKIIR